MKTKQGVSLIVLVITIVVMVILSGAIVLTINNSGIINKATDAVEQTNLATVKELAQMAWASAYSFDATEQELQQAVNDALVDSGIDTSKYIIEVTIDGVSVEAKGEQAVIPEAWQANVVDIVDTVPIPKGFVASKATGENTKNGGLVIYEGTEPVTDANVEDAKRTRNQYVWVPVEDFSEFKRTAYDSYEEISNTVGSYNTYWEIELDLTTNMPKTTQNEEYITAETTAEAIAMYESVKEYKGFYIARYEAGINNSNVCSMMGKSVDSMGYYGFDTALSKARNIYISSNQNYGVTSTLTYGVQWDSVLAWWLEVGAKDGKGNTITDVTNSKTYANYGNSVFVASDFNEDSKYANYWDWNPDEEMSDVLGVYQQITASFEKKSGEQMAFLTGNLKTGKVNNIYDMAGNYSEYVMERSFDEPMEDFQPVERGGNFIYGTSVAGRGVVTGATPRTGLELSFRPSLYIKK